MARQQHSPEEKSRLVLEAIRGERTINEIAAENNIHPNMLSKWKREAETQLYSNRQIIMRSDIKLPQLFASWSNSL